MLLQPWHGAIHAMRLKCSHEDLNVTRVYSHATNKGGTGTRSPADLSRDICLDEKELRSEPKYCSVWQLRLAIFTM